MLNNMKSENVVWSEQHLTKKERSELKKQTPAVIWFTGLSGSGKSTIANALEEKLYNLGKHTYLMDGDNVRHGLNKDLGFSDIDRVENIRRIGEVSKLFVDAGSFALSAFISPFKKDRDLIREMLDEGEFIEIFVDTSLEVCEERDPKGLYKKARKGEILDFTGISSPYEKPENPEIHLKTAGKSVEMCVAEIIKYMDKKGYIKD